MYAWGVILDRNCVLCAGGVESHGHLFFRCPFAAEARHEIRLKCGCNFHVLDLSSEPIWGPDGKLLS